MIVGVSELAAHGWDRRRLGKDVGSRQCVMSPFLYVYKVIAFMYVCIQLSYRFQFSHPHSKSPSQGGWRTPFCDYGRSDSVVIYPAYHHQIDSEGGTCSARALCGTFAVR